MEYPITFNEQSIRAILAGKKTQTRKVIHWHSKNPTKTHIPPHAFYEGFINERFQWYESRDGIEIQALCPYGKIGDTLWVKESLRRYTRLDFLESKPVITNQWLETTFPDVLRQLRQRVNGLLNMQQRILLSLTCPVQKRGGVVLLYGNGKTKAYPLFLCQNGQVE